MSCLQELTLQKYISKFQKKYKLKIHYIDLGNLTSRGPLNKRSLNSKVTSLQNSIEKIINESKEDQPIFIRFNMIVGSNSENHGTGVVVLHNKFYYFNSNGELNRKFVPDMHELDIFNSLQHLEFIDVMKGLNSVNINSGDCGALTLYYFYLFAENRDIARIQELFSEIKTPADIRRINGFISSK